MSITSDALSILEDNLKTNILLYAPEIIYSENQEPSPMVYLHDDLPYNKVTLIIKQGEFIDINFEKPNLPGITTKNLLLRDNLFILMDAKNELSSDQFNLLAKEYVKVLKLVLDYSVDAIYAVKGNFKKNLPEKILLGFETQSRILNEHYLETVKRFGIEADVQEAPKLIASTIDLKTSNEDNMTSTFADFINHDEKLYIEKNIVDNFKTEKGRTIRYIIEYFITRNILILAYGDKLKLFDALNNSFNRDIGSYSSIWSFKFDKRTDENYIATKKKINIYLDNLI